jgi:uncharacterized protein
LSQPSDENSIMPQGAYPRSGFLRVFLNEDGIRSGWSALIFVTASVALLVGVKATFDKSSGLRADEFHLDTFLVREILLASGAVLLTWIMSKIEGRAFKIYGFDGLRPLSRLAIGWLWGFACISMLILALRLCGLLTFTSLSLHGFDAFRYALEWGFVFFLAGVFEEALFRGFLLYTLARGFQHLYGGVLSEGRSKRLGFWTSATLLGVVFFAVHTSHPGDSPIGLFAAFAAALAFSVSIWRTGSLWWIVGFHSAWDWSQSFLYGVGDSGVFFDHRLTTSYPAGSTLFSGGLTGPEGSLLALPTLLFVVLVSVLTLPGGGYEAKLPAARR